MSLWVAVGTGCCGECLPSPTGGWCQLRGLRWGSLEKLVRAAFPEWVGRTNRARLEPLLGKYCFERGVHIPGGVDGVRGGGLIRIIYVLL